MLAIGFHNPTPTLSDDSFKELSLPDPTPHSKDLLIRLHATSVNPVDYKERQKRASRDETPNILGWDGAGTVVATGSDTSGFAGGDQVFWSGELLRPGTNAELQLVDHRLVGRMPSRLSFADAAALPLTAITAYEALFERLQIPAQKAGNVLIIGGAGGVGSIAIQLLRALTDADVFATAGRDDSRAWVEKMGAQHVVDRAALLDERARKELHQFDYVFSTTHSDNYHRIFPEIIKVGGKLALIDDPESFDIAPFKRKSIGVMWELIFSKSLHNHDMASQGRILGQIAGLVDEGKLHSTRNKVLGGLTPQSLIEAHRLHESGGMIGKTVIDFNNG